RPGLGLDHHVEHAVEVHGVAGPGATTRDTGCVVVHAGNRVRLVRGDLVLRVDRRGHGQEERHRHEGDAPQVGRPCRLLACDEATVSALQAYARTVASEPRFWALPPSGYRTLSGAP